MPMQDEMSIPEEDSYTLTFNHDGMKMLFDHLKFSIQIWPGSPQRPREEQEFLQNLKMSCFAALLEYNYEMPPKET